MARRKTKKNPDSGGGKKPNYLLAAAVAGIPIGYKLSKDGHGSMGGLTYLFLLPIAAIIGRVIGGSYLAGVGGALVADRAFIALSTAHAHSTATTLDAWVAKVKPLMVEFKATPALLALIAREDADRAQRMKTNPYLSSRAGVDYGERIRLLNAFAASKGLPNPGGPTGPVSELVWL